MHVTNAFSHPGVAQKTLASFRPLLLFNLPKWGSASRVMLNHPTFSLFRRRCAGHHLLGSGGAGDNRRSVLAPPQGGVSDAGGRRRRHRSRPGHGGGARHDGSPRAEKEGMVYLVDCFERIERA